VFSTKNREMLLTPAIRERLLPYMGGICKKNNLKLLKAGGIENHLHLLVSLPATLTLAKAIQYIKGGSSRWLHDTFKEMDDFFWQEGYGAFTIGVSQIEQTKKYIDNQVEHHKKKSFRDEFVEFLEYHGIDFEEKYLL